MNNNKKNFITTIFGIILVSIGLYLLKTLVNPQGILKALPYVLVGVGCGSFGHGMGQIVSNRALKNTPEIQEQIHIDITDERNVMIANQSKAKAYDMMIFVFGALLLSFTLMDVDMVVILLLVGAYLLVIGCAVYYRVKYDREM